MQQRLPPGLTGPVGLLGEPVVREARVRLPTVAHGGEQHAGGGDQHAGDGEAAEPPADGDHLIGDRLASADGAHDVPDEQEEERRDPGQDRGEHGDDRAGAGSHVLGCVLGAGVRAGGHWAGRVVVVARVGDPPADGLGAGGGRAGAQFLAGVHKILIFRHRAGGDGGHGAQGHGAQLFGIEPLSYRGGQFRVMVRGTQRLVEYPLEFRAVLGQQVRSAVHVHPPMLRRALLPACTGQWAETEESLLRISRW